jgi:SAM-dependent methyltransferase
VDLDAAALKDVRDIAAAVALEEALPGTAGVACANVDALNLPFSDEVFDRIVVSEVFEHIPDFRAAIDEVVRVLRPGGTVAATVPRFWPEAVCWALSDEYHSNEGGHVRIFRRGRLIRALRLGGLNLYRSHHAHSLHAPYWWLKCLVGVREESHPWVSAYHRFLAWDIGRAHPLVRLSERALDPFLGKSVVLYLQKPDA